MDRATRLDRLCGCYVTVPTMFRDGDLELDLPAMQKHVNFLIGGGLKTGNGVILAGGAAGDFSTMSFDERVAVAETVVEAAQGRVPVIMGAQTTNTRELVALAKAAERVGADLFTRHLRHNRRDSGCGTARYFDCRRLECPTNRVSFKHAVRLGLFRLHDLC